MSLTSLTLVLSGLGVLVTSALAVMFFIDPAKGLAQVTHRHENLPQVMTNRYFFMAFMALGATLYGDLNVISFLFAGLAFMAFADAVIYYRAGTPIAKHVAAGLLASLVAVVACCAAQNSGVSA